MHRAPLANHSFIKTTNIFEAEKFVEKSLGSILQFPRHSQKLDLNANRMVLRDLDIWFCAYGAPVTLSFPDNDYFRMQFHCRGSGATLFGNEQIDVSAQQVVMGSGQEAIIKFGQGFEQIVVRINRIRLMQKLAALTGIGSIRSLEFEKCIDINRSEMTISRRILDIIINSEFSSSLGLFIAEMEQVYLSSVLFSCPSNYSNVLNKEPAKPAPWQVCLAEQYIEANWDKPIDIEKIAEISKCSARSIFRSFKQSRGYSPMNFVKQIRLQQANKMLTDPDVNTTVTTIALACGFSDLGRFSRDYKKMFGYAPSDMLKHTRKTSRI